MDAKFQKAVNFVRNGPSRSTLNTEKLEIYALYKQATEGDVTSAQPWSVQLEARAKWDAWNNVKGLSKSDAMERYVALIASTSPDWEQHEAAKNP